jgi:hypothetical protein
MVTTNPDDAWEIERLRVLLADEKAAHATTRQNFAEHVGAEFPQPLRRWDSPLTDAEKARFLAADRELNGPAGLSADQHIRARALDAAVNMLADGDEGEFGDSSEVSVRWVLATADRMAAWIRDGEVPDA